MHPDIAAFPNEWFYQQEQLRPVPLSHQLEERLDYNEPSEDALDEQLKQHRVLFLPADDEASLVVDVLRRLYRQIGHERFDAAHSIGVIVTYRHQIAMIRREMARLGLPQLDDISIDTVERYQGSQRDVIIYSTGIQDHDGLDFLTSNSFEEDGVTIDRKLNVAMTRARKQLIMIGNASLLRQNSIFSELIARYST
jgi:superfamily I DNA and/or RNA helicase